MSMVALYLYVCGYFVCVWGTQHVRPQEPTWKPYIGSIFWPFIVPLAGFFKGNR